MTTVGIPTTPRAAMIAALEKGRAQLEACKDDQIILAWKYGLGVLMKGKTPMAVNLDKATGFGGNFMKAVIPHVTNGRGEEAMPVRRQAAIAKQVAELDRLIMEAGA